MYPKTPIPSSPARSSRSGHLVDLERPQDRLSQRLARPGLAEVREQPVVAEHGQPGVLERDQRHQRVTVVAVPADRVGIGSCRLVAVVAVGDQELGLRELGGDRAVGLRIVDAPDPVRDAVVVDGLGPARAA